MPLYAVHLNTMHLNRSCSPVRKHVMVAMITMQWHMCVCWCTMGSTSVTVDDAL